jgi:hypothetical protein
VSVESRIAEVLRQVIMAQRSGVFIHKGDPEAVAAAIATTLAEPRFGMDITESDRALVVAEQRLDAIRKLCDNTRTVATQQGTIAAVHVTRILAILDSDDTPKEKQQ